MLPKPVYPPATKKLTYEPSTYGPTWQALLYRSAPTPKR
jgi:hypothetical protein